MTLAAWIIVVCCLAAICFFLKFAHDERKEHEDYMKKPPVDDPTESMYEPETWIKQFPRPKKQQP